MLAKLSLRNAKRSMKDYSIYILTITIIFSLLYSFQMLSFSKEIKALAKNMETFQLVLIFVSCIIVFVVAWLIHYMNRFMLEKRGRELGTYMLLGISNESITHLVLIENVIVGSIAFLLGILLGTFLYQIFLQIIMNIFKVPYQLGVPFTSSALILTGIFGLVSYIVSMFRMARKLKRIRICDLIYINERNDKKSKKITNYWITCIIAVVLCIIGGVLFFLTCYELKNLSRACIGFICFIIGIYLFYGSFASMLIRRYIFSKKRKYEKEHLFLMRNLSSKMKSMKMTLGTLALLLLISLAAFQNGLFLQTIFNVAEETSSPFDVLVMTSKESYDFNKYDDYLREKVGIKSAWSYPMYETSDSKLQSFFKQNDLVFEDQILVMRISDYHALRKMKGYENIELETDHFLIHGYKEAINTILLKSVPDLTIHQHLKFQMANHEALPLIFENLFCVVPDEMVDGLPMHSQYYVALTSQQLSSEQNEEIKAMDKDVDDRPYVRLKTELQKERNVELVTLLFSLFYIGFIFVCIVATILAVQQLSEASQYQYRYRILSSLGVGTKKINLIIFKQLSFYFGIPLILPVVISIWLTICFSQVYRNYINNSYLISVIVRTLGLFFVVYFLYFIATYIGYVKNVNKNRIREE